MRNIIAILATIFGILLLLSGVAVLVLDLGFDGPDRAQLLWGLLSWDQSSWEQLSLTSLGELWYHFHPASLNLSEAVVARYLWEDLWYEWIVVILAWPAAAVFAGLGLLMVWIGKVLR